MKEHKFVIVRTYKNHVANCYAFATHEYNCGHIAPVFSGARKIADEINIKPYVGGMLAVELITWQTNGQTMYPTTETIYFDRNIVSAVEIHTEFDNCRIQAAQTEESTNECLSDGLSAQLIATVPDYYRYCPCCGAHMIGGTL